jgi:hypothetical protein
MEHVTVIPSSMRSMTVRCIFASYAFLYLVSLTINLIGLAEQEAAYVQKVNSHVCKDEVFQFLERRLVAEYRIT